MSASRNGLLTAGALAMMAHVPGSMAALSITPYVSGTITFDNNLPRLPNNAAALESRGDPRREDTIKVYTFGLDLDQALGPQNFKLGAAASRTEHNRFSEQDFNGHTVSADWDWALGSRLAGTLSFADDRALENFSNRVDNIDERGFVDTTTVALSTGLTVLRRFELKPALETRRVRHTLQDSQQQDLDEDLLRLSLGWIVAGRGNIGLEGAITQGDFLRRDPDEGVVEEYEQYTLQFVGEWQHSPLTSVNFGLGHTRRDNEGTAADDNSGLVGTFNVTRQISVKTSVYVGAYRSLASSEIQGESTVVSTGWNAGGSWAPTSQLSFTGTYFAQEDEFEDSVLLLDADIGSDSESGDRSDDLQGVQLAMSYTPFYWLVLRPFYRWEDRSSAILSQDYHAYQVGLELRVQYPIK